MSSRTSCRAIQSPYSEYPSHITSREYCPPAPPTLTDDLACHAGWQDLGAFDHAFLGFWATQKNIGVMDVRQALHCLGSDLASRTLRLIRERSSYPPGPPHLPLQLPIWFSSTSKLPVTSGWLSLLHFLPLPQTPNCVSLPAYLPIAHGSILLWFNTSSLPVHAATSPDQFLMVLSTTKSSIFQFVLASGVPVQKLT